MGSVPLSARGCVLPAGELTEGLGEEGAQAYVLGE